MRAKLTLPRLIEAAQRYWASDGAASAIEFAFVSPFIIAIILATAQLAIIFVAQSYMEAMSEEGKRTVLTNQANTMTASQFATAVCGNITALFTCGNLVVSLQTLPSLSGYSTPSQVSTALSGMMPTYTNTGTLKNTPTYTQPSGNTKMALVLQYQWPLITGPFSGALGYFGSASLNNGKYLLSATQVFQVEPPKTQ